jgi:hypothetical protein
MKPCVTRCAQSDEVLFGIVSEQAALPNVMNLEFAHGSTLLATPAVSTQHPLS